MQFIKPSLIFKTIFLISIGFASACSIYKIDIRQGNYITQDMVDKLRPNQSKSQVQEILGSPAHIPVLNKNIWIYDYSFVPGSRKHNQESKALSLKFSNNKLQSYAGDWEIKQLKKEAN